MNVEVLGSQPVSPKACAPSPELLEVQGLMPMAPEDRERLKDSIEREGVRGFHHPLLSPDIEAR